MKRECVQKFLSGFFVFCIALSFSISSFAAAFTGAYMTTEIDPVTGIPTTVIKDVNPTGQTYSGQNVVEMNAYNNAPVLTNNTFNGSTDINPDFTSITSTGNAYNGSVDINYDGLGGTLDSNGDRFQSTTVTAQQSDISISNGTFNGTTNINAQSVSLGSITQMDTLNSKIDYLIANFLLYKEIMFSTSETFSNSGLPSALQFSGTYNGVTVRQDAIYYAYNAYTFSNGVLSSTIYRYRSSFAGMLNHYLTWIFQNFMVLFNYLIHNILWNSGPYNLYTFTVSGETYSLTTPNQTNYLRDAFINRIDTIISILDWYAHRFFEWYYPLDNTLPEYWRYYNTDTALQEDIGLAGLMYNISWYLGQMYVLQSESTALNNFTDQVEAVTEVFEDAEEAEQDIMDSISSGIESFNPDVSELGTFRALGWCSNYLQLVFLRLGTYGTVILIGLLLGVCMQFIGYFRYKT